MKFLMHRLLVVLAMVFSLLFTSTAMAALTYQLTFDQSEYTATPGSTVEVQVFLRETASGSDTARLAVGGGDGLFGAGFSLDYSVSSSLLGSSVPDADPQSARIQLNPVFDDVGSSERVDAGDVLRVSAATTDFVSGIEVAGSGGVFDIRIATITFDVSSVGGNITTLQLGDFGAGAQTGFLDGFSPEDTGALTFSSATINSQATAVPEPSSLAVFTGGVVCFWMRRRRRGARASHVRFA